MDPHKKESDALVPDEMLNESYIWIMLNKIANLLTGSGSRDRCNCECCCECGESESSCDAKILREDALREITLSFLFGLGPEHGLVEISTEHPEIPRFIVPEAPDYSPKSDIYSLGICIWFAASRKMYDPKVAATDPWIYSSELRDMLTKVCKEKKNVFFWGP